MSLYFTSDLHFYHKNILKYQSNRNCETLDEMHSVLINNWNNLISENDNVIICGDFCFARVTKTSEMVKQLKGNKILLRGNHDYLKPNKYEELGFTLKKYMIIDDYFCGHYPIYTDEQFEYDMLNRKIDDQTMIRKIYGEYKQAFIDSGCTKVIHGHIHSFKMDNSDIFQFNCGVDVNNMSPVNYEFIKGL
jgi:calcineurin-like phosphoesterase family protein